MSRCSYVHLRPMSNCNFAFFWIYFCSYYSDSMLNDKLAIFMEYYCQMRKLSFYLIHSKSETKNYNVHDLLFCKCLLFIFCRMSPYYIHSEIWFRVIPVFYHNLLLFNSIQSFIAKDKSWSSWHFSEIGTCKVDFPILSFSRSLNKNVCPGSLSDTLSLSFLQSYAQFFIIYGRMMMTMMMMMAQ